ncbi:tetratricopeptide repeat protein [Gammaproteobacteria bacterium]|nr:tetratricopeptide repeat protein [Gammaproteobacteria bacterium]
MKTVLHLRLILLSALLTSCANQIIDSTDQSTATNINVADPIEIPLKPIPIESLYDLLVGDVALSRNQFDVALHYYSGQARITGDREIIDLAHRIAEYLSEQALQLEMALLWVQFAPQDPKAHRAALGAYLDTGEAASALKHGQWLYENEDDFDALLFIVSSTLNSQAQRSEFLNSVLQLTFSPEKQSSVQLLAAILLQSDGQLEKSENYVRDFLNSRPDDQKGVLLLAQILHQRNQGKEAIKLLKDALQKFPKDRELRTQYARFLAVKSPERAIAQFELLRSEDPNDQEVNFVLGLMQYSQGRFEIAKDLLRQASIQPSLRANAQYHLGVIADRQRNISEAINYYSQVRYGRNYIVAASRLSALLADHRSIDEARQYLQRLRISQPNKAISLFQVESNLLLRMRQPRQALIILSTGLENYPDDPELLYARSMVAEQQDNFALAESDLRSLLAQDEDNATVLNALGYTMILHTDRREEAYELILRAYSLAPNEPSIIDSLGWALFKLGRPIEALEYLTKAFDIVSDPEIASHLGEVLWALEYNEKAMDVWLYALKENPNHTIILETMLRLGANASVEP